MLCVFSNRFLKKRGGEFLINFKEESRKFSKKTFFRKIKSGN